MIKKLLPIISIATISIGLGCNRSVVSYGDAKAVESLNVDFSSTDLQLIADKLTTSLINSNSLKPNKNETNKPPLISITRLKNETSEHIDTKSITDKIRTALVKTGKLRFSALDAENELYDQYVMQEQMANKKTRKNIGNQTGSQYILNGDISSIVKEAGRVKDVYYKITLKLVDIESAEIHWADEVEIRKNRVKSLMGL